MRLDSLKSFLDEACVQSNVVHYESESRETFSAVVYCLLSGCSYDEQCSGFIKRFSAETQTNWISCKRCPNQVRYLFRKTFSCHLSTRNKTSKARKTKNNIRDKDCKAKIDFKWKIVNKDTWKNDHNLKYGLNCVINIVFDHSHPIVSADAMSFLRCPIEKTKQFYSYFVSGLSPVAAKHFHEISLIEIAEDDDSAAISLANAQINPTLRQVFYFHDTWKKDHQEPLVTTLDSLLQKKKDLENNDYHVGINEESLDVAIVTPIMKRVFGEFAKQDNVVFIESSDSFSTSKVVPAVNNLFITLVFISSKIGALPIACVLHNSHNFQSPLTLLKETLERATGTSFKPSVIMTYDSAILRIALRTLFPTANILLSTSPIRQGTWKWMGVAKHKVNNEDRTPIMKSFEKVLRAPTTDSANEAFKELSATVKDNPQAIKHFENWWSRRSEWGLSLRKEVVPEGVDMEDCEASVRMLRDTLLHKCKGFTTPALMDLACSVVEIYHKERLRDLASGQEGRVTCHYSKFCQTLLDADVVEVGVHEYHVHSGTEDKSVHTVYTDLAVCDCKSGKDGRYCGHLAAVEKNCKFWTPPVLSEEERSVLAKIAFGSELSERDLKLLTSQQSPFVNVKSEPEDFCSDTEMPEREVASCSNSSPLSIVKEECIGSLNEISSNIRTDPEMEVASCSNSPIGVSPLTIVKEESIGSNNETISIIRTEFDRVADLLEWSSPGCSPALAKFCKLLQDVKTPAQAYQLFANNVQHISCSADDAQSLEFIDPTQ